MANYKVIQDVESEDKILWKLSIKQVFFALFGFGIIYLGYLGLTYIHWIILVIFILIALPLIFLALPLGKDQPNEVWLMSQLNFLFRPRKRLWQPLGNHKVIEITQHASDQNLEVAPVNTKEAYQKAVNISQVLDAQSQATSSAGVSVGNQNWEDQVQARQTNLYNQFNDKLVSNYTSKQQALNQGSANSEAPSLLSTNPQLLAQFDTILETAETQNLKISTLESMLLANHSSHNVLK